MPRPGIGCVIIQYLCSNLLFNTEIVLVEETQLVCFYLEEEQNLQNKRKLVRSQEKYQLIWLSIGLTKLTTIGKWSSSSMAKMATFVPSGLRVMRVKRSGTKQLLFSDVSKKSASLAEWKEHEIRFAKKIEAVSKVSSKLEELKSKGKEYKPNVYESVSL